MPDLKPEERHALTLLARGSIGRALAMAADGQLASYQRLVAALAAAPVDRLVLDELSGELARTADGASLTGALTLLQELLARVIAAGLRPPRTPAVPGRGAPARSASRRAVPLIAGRRCGTRSRVWRPRPRG